jgi:hypothetical protein
MAELTSATRPCYTTIRDSTHGNLHFVVATPGLRCLQALRQG